MSKHILVVSALMLLSACGGGDGNVPVEDARIPVEDVQDLTNSQPPLETRADQSARAAGIISRADSLIVSTMYIETTDPDFPRLQVRADCSGTRCTIREPRLGFTDTVSIDDSGFRSSTSRSVLSKNGITLIEHNASDVGVYDSDRAYVSWMQHSVFHVQEARAVVDEVTLWGRRGRAAGDLTGYHPDTSATWRGVMVGTPATGADRGDFLQGDAVLSYDFNTSGYAEVDAAFTNIKNIDRNRDHSVASIRFDDVPAYTDGTFEAGLTGNRIQGGFYGPGHAETAGIFEQQGVVGSFGAKR